MKKALYLVIGLAAALSAISSCVSDKEFLTEEPKTIYTIENAFEKASQIDAALIRCYTKFNSMNFVGLGSDGAADFLKGSGSDMLGGTRGNGASGAFSNFWALQTTNGNFNSVWNSCYQLIAYSNLVFQGLGVIEGLSAEENGYLSGQANFFKGWAYLRLAELFGGVPIQESLGTELKFDYERTTREETYNYAIQCFEAALSGLPEYPKQPGRVAKGIVNHFLAEAYLARGVETGSNADFTKSISYADAVISKYPIMTQRFGSRSENGKQPAGIPDNGVPRYQPDGNVFWDLFQIGNVAYGANGNTESLMIFEQPLYEKRAQFGGQLYAYGVSCGPAYRDASWSEAYKAGEPSGGPWKGRMDGDLFPGKQLGVYLTGSWGMIATMDYADEFVWRGDLADDLRNSDIVLWTPVVMDMDSPRYLQPTTKEMLADPAYHARISCKYTTRDLWGWNLSHCSSMGAPYVNQFGRDWYIARSAETYLLRAEAKLRGGDAAGAAADINAVRSRSQAKKLYSAGEVDLEVILDERARELAWEEMRWPTLMRMGKGGQTSKGENPVVKKHLETHTFSAEIMPATFANRTLPEWTLFAIPFNAINLNKDGILDQNYGWTNPE
ncbi:MAG: RagB/SusD family nutrient uptake outer membrane protein [Bacteroidales bacterium]|nr:RagB/SusD family nutrient uptake outer membrane protein [Bacteroidales bacterium]